MINPMAKGEDSPYLGLLFVIGVLTAVLLPALIGPFAFFWHDVSIFYLPLRYGVREAVQ